MPIRKLFSRTRSEISRRATSATACAPAHAATAWRKRSASVGRSRLKCVTVPARAGGVEHARRARRRRAAARAAPRGPVSASSAPGTPATQRAVAVALDADAHLLGLAAAALAQLVDRAGGDEPAVLDDRHVLAQPLDELELVRGEDDGHAGVRALAQHAAHHVDAGRVEAGERLVEHEHLRVVDERDAELDALLVAERERLDAVAGALARPSRSIQRSAARAAPAAGEPVQAREVHELVAHAHLRVQAALLRHVAEARARARRRSARPFQRTRPASGASTPSTIRIAVVLPAPLGPTKPSIRPGATENVRSSSATTSPKRRVSPSSSSMAGRSSGGSRAKVRLARRSSVFRRAPPIFECGALSEMPAVRGGGRHVSSQPGASRPRPARPCPGAARGRAGRRR